MKGIFGLTVVLMLFVGIIGTGSWAYFTDPETSADNPMTAGSMDLKTDDIDGVTQTIYATNMKRGDNVSGNITLKNIGTNDGPTLDIAFSYIESDDSPNSVDMSPDATAATLEVTTLNYDGSSLLDYVSDNNTNGYKDVQDLDNADLTDQSGLNSLASKDFEVTLKLKETTGNDFQGDGITVTITFILNQWEL
jgi:spore coat-associated protein N